MGSAEKILSETMFSGLLSLHPIWILRVDPIKIIIYTPLCGLMTITGTSQDMDVATRIHSSLVPSLARVPHMVGT